MNKNLPLSGLKIIDMTQYLPGPLATKILSDLGAEVIKVEFGEGDFLRIIPPFSQKMSLLFQTLNAGKKSLGLNVQKNEGYEILSKLLQQSDTLIHSFRTRRAAKLKITFDQLRKIQPQIILCEMLADFEIEAGHDLNFLSLSGILSLRSKQTGDLPYFQIGDLMGGTLSVVSSLLATIIMREKTRRPQHLQISMLEGTKYFLNFYFKSVQKNGIDTLDILRGKAPCYNIYRCKDGKKIAMAALEPIFWANICEVIKHKDLLDKQFDENYIPELKNIFSQKNRGEWLKMFNSSDTTVSPLLDRAEVSVNKQFPAKFNDQSFNLAKKAPLLGEDTKNILENLGYSKVEILRLRSERIVL
ncbi:CoA transferase [Candidatus Roizmanbacteria bacterium]|nr:CoA transferase [Candidatus Roizmanbacteria bacterium]